jgi:EF-P beta-lysylation protein EpmB
MVSLPMIHRIEANLQTNWQKELANAVSDPETLLNLLEIDSNQVGNDFSARKLFAMRVPKPFITRMEKGNLNDPLLKQVLPVAEEFETHPGYTTDPLEEQNNAQPGLLHKYKSRVLIIFRGGCAINCRYCFRRHFPYQDNSQNKQGLKQAIEYIAKQPEINEVILSGGDPLMANDQALEWFISQLEQVKHIARLRIHSRLPVVIPARITNEFLALPQTTKLKLILVTHINHANEIDDVLKGKLIAVKQAGFTLLNQAVFLKGVNDSVVAQVALSETLFEADVLPYYLHLFDKVQGAHHFNVSDSDATDIYQQLLLELPGFLVPKLVREIGGEKSKTPVDLGLYQQHKNEQHDF